MTDLPPGFVLEDQSSQTSGLPEGFVPEPQQPYTGAILPFSTDAQGQARFDPNAGFLGGIKRLFQAAAAPGDVYSGKLATPYSGSNSSEASPEVTNRALDFAMAFSPASAALRAGSMVPGAAWGTTVPNAQQLKDTASLGYAAARASPETVPGDAIANAAQQIQQTLLNQHGIVEETAPKTYAILNKLANPPPVTDPDMRVLGTYPGLEAARRGLSALKADGSTEGFAAGKAIPELDKFIDSISPDAATARANMAAAFRSNDLTGALDRANTGILEQAEARAHASHSGTNIDNSIRGRIASFLQNPENVSGYSQPEIDSLNNLVKGGAVQNAARKIGNYFGGGGGLGSLAATMAGATIGSSLMPGIEGPAVGAAVPTALGISAKSLENALSRRALGGVDEMVRSRSPLAQSLQSVMVPAIGRSNTLRAPAFIPNPQQVPPSLAQILAQGAPVY